MGMKTPTKPLREIERMLSYIYNHRTIPPLPIKRYPDNVNDRSRHWVLKDLHPKLDFQGFDCSDLLSGFTRCVNWTKKHLQVSLLFQTSPSRMLLHLRDMDLRENQRVYGQGPFTTSCSNRQLLQLSHVREKTLQVANSITSLSTSNNITPISTSINVVATTPLWQGMQLVPWVVGGFVFRFLLEFVSVIFGRL